LDLFLQLALNGLVEGMRYGLVALGFALVLSVTGYVHFAHGAVCTLAGYVFYVLWVSLGLHWLLAAGGSLAVSLVLSVGLCLGIYRRVPAASHHGVFICSLGLMILLQNLTHLVWGSESVSLRAGGMAQVWFIGPAVITDVGAATILLSLAALLATSLLLHRTGIGRAMRATADQPYMAAVVGIDTRRVAVAAFTVAALLIAPVGVLTGLDEGLSPHTGTGLILAAIAGAIVGGIGSLSGAVLGGLLIGLLQQLSAGWLPTSWMSTITFLGMFAFIVFHPRGLFGKRLRVAEL
jgi:branched-subunit amino acid ABC-type transport system permease component